MREKVAVFLDAENLTHWMKNNGPEKLLSELSSIGQIIVRRAYGKWTNQNLQMFQAELNRQGFELIHNYHPVSGKNSSDIQLTVDAMEYALKLSDVNWFVLATGDSDFSPLFRRLREMGKEVVGVGPRSPLSESVKTSCSRFIYTDIGSGLLKKEVLSSELDDAIDLLEKVLKMFDGPTVCSALKDQMTTINSAFNEKALGFKSFTDFLKSVDFVQLSLGPDGSTWYASYIQSSIKSSAQQHVDNNISVDDLYRRFLRKKGLRLISKDLLVDIYNIIVKFKPIMKNELVDEVLSNTQEEITSTDIRKAISIFWKAKLFSFNDSSEIDSDDRLLKLEKKDDFIKIIDKTLLIRLLSAIEESSAIYDTDAISRILYGEYNNEQLESILKEVKEEIKQIAEQNTTMDGYSTDTP